MARWDVPFPFQIAKTAEVAAAFLELSGGQMNVMKLVKLVYLLDRMSFERRGIPVVGGEYISMKNGPVTSEVLDLINSGRLAGDGDDSWAKHIEDRQGHDVRLISSPERRFLSDGELSMVQEVWVMHGEKDQWQLRNWCHEHCPEWTKRASGRSSIFLGSIGSAIGKSPEQIHQMREEAEALALLRTVLA